MRLNIRLLSSIKSKTPFFVTTPIFYVNAAPHIGHIYSAVVADAVQRFEKLVNPDINVIFATGTDEHGTKIQQAAAKANLPPAEYCDKISGEYRTLFDDYNIQYTDFVRTTEERHKKAVTHFWNKLKRKDYIYKSKYSGWYSVNDESFVTESQIKEEVINGEKVKVSLESGHRLEWTEEENYMFRLSAFKGYLLDWLKQDGVIRPSKFQNQLREWLEREVYFPDISVSRPSSRVHWAIRVPNDESQSIYVWLDALINYLTVCGYPDEELMMSSGRPWPADVQVVGKDILKFHGIYWPAFLMACKLHPPRSILCHGHWTVDGAKMSKSLGNVVSPRHPVGYSGMRYLLLREHTMHSDANFSETKLVNTINAELADTIGNLVSRCVGAALNPRELFPELDTGTMRSSELVDCVERLPDTCHEYYRNYQFYKVVDSVIHALHLANAFFESNKPWELKKKPECQKELDAILHITMETLRISAIILQPIIPDLARNILDKFLIPEDERYWQHCGKVSWRQGGIVEARKIQSGKFVLFPRIYSDKKVSKKAKG